MLKQIVRRIPVIGRRLVSPTRRAAFTTSAEYWEGRYRKGGNSGSGTYNRLGQYKAGFLNRFVREHGVSKVVDHGCGDGHQVTLAEHPAYVGIDISPTIIAACRRRFADRPGFSFLNLDEAPDGVMGDLAISLDVIYHLIEDEAFEGYMARLFDSSSRFVIIYASNKDAPGTAPHVRHRRFTDWIERHRPGFELIHWEPNPYPFDPADPTDTSFAEFHVFQSLRS